MPTYRTCFRDHVLISFGDLTDATKAFEDSEGDLVFQDVNRPDLDQRMSFFTRETVRRIIEDWEEFGRLNRYDPDFGRWYPRDDIRS